MCNAYEILLSSPTPLTITQISQALNAPIPKVSKTLWHMLYLGKVERIIKNKKVFWKTP